MDARRDNTAVRRAVADGLQCQRRQRSDTYPYRAPTVDGRMVCRLRCYRYVKDPLDKEQSYASVTDVYRFNKN